MRVFINATINHGPYGGANSFLRTLVKEIEKRGGFVTFDSRKKVDIALLNALTNNLDIALVRQVSENKIPIIHRKVGFVVSGGPEMRKVVDGVVWGNKLQIDFSPYVKHSIFQSEYSRDTFISQGFSGAHSVIYNGTDNAIYNLQKPKKWWQRNKGHRELWDEKSPLRVVISTWSISRS